MIAQFIRSDAMAQTYGKTPNVSIEAEWFQFTYNELRTAPNGDFVANFDETDDAWYIKGEPYSDIVIEEGKEG